MVCKTKQKFRCNKIKKNLWLKQNELKNQISNIIIINNRMFNILLIYK